MKPWCRTENIMVLISLFLHLIVLTSTFKYLHGSDVCWNSFLWSDVFPVTTFISKWGNKLPVCWTTKYLDMQRRESNNITWMSLLFTSTKQHIKKLRHVFMVDYEWIASSGSHWLQTSRCKGNRNSLNQTHIQVYIQQAPFSFCQPNSLIWPNSIVEDTSSRWYTIINKFSLSLSLSPSHTHIDRKGIQPRKLC